MTSVFIVQHLHRHSDGEDCVKMIGVYRSMESARAAVERLRIQPGFQELPAIVTIKDEDDQGFHIDEYLLDKDHWAEGYFTDTSRDSD